MKRDEAHTIFDQVGLTVERMAHTDRPAPLSADECRERLSRIQEGELSAEQLFDRPRDSREVTFGEMADKLMGQIDQIEAAD